MNDYVILTAARNEAAHIQKTLDAVTAQSVLPRLWVVVSDGSTDDTDQLVQQAAEQHAFIKYVRRDPPDDRSFDSKAHAIQLAYEQVDDTPHDVVAILDGDTSFEPNYYTCLLEHFAANEHLGVAGGVICDWDGETFIPKKVSTESSVGGPSQTFRKTCWEDIGGYRPMTYGGVDAVAETMARMKGWQVKTFTELKVYHHRPTGSEGQSRTRALFRLGIQNYTVGYHPLFMFARCLRREFRGLPHLGEGILPLLGFLAAALRREPRQVDDALVTFLQKEQCTRLGWKR